MVNNSQNKQLVVVLGMHRSGTSCITRGLKVLGVNLGDRLMPAHPEVNAKGFWEDLDFNALNIEILEVIGNGWSCLSPLRQVDIDYLLKKGFQDRAQDLLLSKIKDKQIFGIKDPRMTKLLPFWKIVIKSSGIDDSYILSHRNPMSVAESLFKRDGFEYEKSYLLWLVHVIYGIYESQDSKRVLVDYEQLLSSPDIELEKVAKKLGLPFDEQEFENYRTNFLDEELRHGRHDSEDILKNPIVPEIVKEVYEVMNNVAKGKVDIDNPNLVERIEDWYKRIGDMSTPLLLADKYFEKSEYLRKDRALKVKHIDDFNKHSVEYNMKIDILNEHINSIKQQLSEQEQQLSKQEQLLAEQEQLLSEREQQIAELDEEVVRRGHWALDLEKELKNTRFQMNRILSGNSWKLTRPFRVIRRILTQKAEFEHFQRRFIAQSKRLYLLLPLSYQTRNNHRQIIAKYLPKLLYHPDSYIWEESAIKMPKCNSEYDPDSYNGDINITTSSDPLVSVIIPVYGHCGCTLRCLASIENHPPRAPFELIVVDDCSLDNSRKVLQRVGGIKVISNDTNQGFIRSCNAGAAMAKGKYVYFLNNDTEVMDGWLDELVYTFDSFSKTGLAGSKLIYPNGSLQEAGGIVWKDGSAWNFGKDQDPSLPVFSYAREVDYCSGASIMILKALFDELKGFDEHYLPAYCEDSDFAFRIRQKGYRAIFQPRSNIVHYEGFTSGTDTQVGVKSYQLENSKKLFLRWQEQLKGHHSNGENVDDAKDRYMERRVLVIDHCTPTPDQDAGSVTVFNIMLLLREMKFQVTFIPEDNFMNMSKYTGMLQGAGIEALYAPFNISVEQHLKKEGHRYDLLFLFRPKVVEHHLDAIRRFCPAAKVLYHTVDLHFLRMQREAELMGDAVKRKAAAQMKDREYMLIRQVDATIVHSTKEYELLKPDLPNETISVFPLIMEVFEGKKSLDKRQDIVFIGGYQHLPNVDAVQYFVSEIMPILEQRLSGVRFLAVGSKPPSEILALASDNVEITGFVEDLGPLLDTVRLAVAPLRYGAGIKGKIGTTMAYGVPTIGTTLAVEGMSLSDGENILVADGPESFAEAIVQLYKEDPLWHSMSEASIKFAKQTWGVEAAWKILSDILLSLEIATKDYQQELKLYSPSNFKSIAGKEAIIKQ